jgi:hypothetical protein
LAIQFALRLVSTGRASGCVPTARSTAICPLLAHAGDPREPRNRRARVPMTAARTMHPPPAPAPVHLDDLLATFRRLPPRMGALWDVAYGRAPLAVLGPDSAMATWHQERGQRLLLALALIVPEPTLRAQFERVVVPTARATDVAELMRPLALARDAAATERPSLRALARAMVELISGQHAPAAKARAATPGAKRKPARHAPKAKPRARPRSPGRVTRAASRGRAA